MPFLSVLGVGVYFFVKKYIPKSTGNTLPVSHPMQKVDSLKFDSSSFKIKPPLASSNGKEIKSKEDTQTRRNLKPNNDIASTNLAMQDIVWVYYDRPKFSSVDSRGSGSEKIESNISLAEKAFDAGDFETVLNLLDKISNQEKTDIQWLKGHTLFNLRRFSDAEKSFRESSELGKEERQKRAEWNRTLCILAMGKRQEAQSLLTIIAMETGGLFEEKAKEILLKIK